MPLGVADEVGDNEEVVHEAHLADHVHLIGELLPVVLRGVGIALGKAVQAQLFKIGVPVGPALGQLELGQVVGAKLELHIAEVGDFLGVLQGLRAALEELGHLVLALHIELLGLKLHPARLVHRLAHLDAHEHILGPGVLPGQVVGVVGGHQRDARLLVEA